MRSHRFFVLLMTALLLLPAGAKLHGQAVQYRYLDYKLKPMLWGLKGEAWFGFRILPDTDTAIWVNFGSAWSDSSYFRLANGDLYRLDRNSDIDPSLTTFSGWKVLWGIGIRQGFLANPLTDRDDWTIQLSWRGFGDSNRLDLSPDNLLAISDDQTRNGPVVNSVQFDLHFDNVIYSRQNNTRRGVIFDAALELANGFMSQPDTIRFLQESLSLKGFLPVYEKHTDKGLNIFSLSVAGRLAMDLIQGLGTDSRHGIPYGISQRFGGYEYVDGLGEAVRGLGNGWGDGTLKGVANLELRGNLPAILHPDLMFGFVAYLDGGFYTDPPGTPTASPFRSGAYTSTGLGVFLDFFHLGTGVIYTNFLLNAPDYRNRYWVPLSLGFDLHF